MMKRAMAISARSRGLYAYMANAIMQPTFKNTRLKFSNAADIYLCLVGYHLALPHLHRQKKTGTLVSYKKYGDKSKFAHNEH
jgi:hypothetical protein